MAIKQKSQCVDFDRIGFWGIRAPIRGVDLRSAFRDLQDDALDEALIGMQDGTDYVVYGQLPDKTLKDMMSGRANVCVDGKLGRITEVDLETNTGEDVRDFAMLPIYKANNLAISMLAGGALLKLLSLGFTGIPLMIVGSALFLLNKRNESTANALVENYKPPIPVFDALDWFTWHQ